MYRDWWKPGLKQWRRFPEARIPPPDSGGESFVTVQRFPLNRHEDGEAHLAPLYFDFDGDDLGQVTGEVLGLIGYLSDFLDLPPEATRLYYTGNRGLHVEVPEEALGVTAPTPDLTYAYGRWARALAERLELDTLDRSVYSCRRMWRQVGSRHARTGRYKVEVAPGELLRGPAYLRRLAGRPRPLLPYPLPALVPAAAETLRGYLRVCQECQPVTMGTPAIIRSGYAPPCVARLLRVYWQGVGKSNRVLLFLASWMCSTRMPEEQAVLQAGDWFQSAPAALFRSPPRDRAHEAEKVVRCVYRSARYAFGCRFARALGLCLGVKRCSG